MQEVAYKVLALKLDETEIREIRSLFDRVDTEGRGYVYKRDLQKLLLEKSPVTARQEGDKYDLRVLASKVRPRLTVVAIVMTTAAVAEFALRHSCCCRPRMKVERYNPLHVTLGGALQSERDAPLYPPSRTASHPSPICYVPPFQVLQREKMERVESGGGAATSTKDTRSHKGTMASVITFDMFVMTAIEEDDELVQRHLVKVFEAIDVDGSGTVRAAARQRARLPLVL